MQKNDRVSSGVPTSLTCGRLGRRDDGVRLSVENLASEEVYRKWGQAGHAPLDIVRVVVRPVMDPWGERG